MFSFIVLNSGFLSTVCLSVRIYVEVVRYVNLSFWREILWLTLRSDSLFAPTRLYVEIVPYIKKLFRHLGIYFLLLPTRIVLGRETQRRFPFGDSYLLLLVPRNYFRSDIRCNFPADASDLILFGARSDLFWDSRSPEIPSQGFLLVFPRWGLT